MLAAPISLSEAIEDRYDYVERLQPSGRALNNFRKDILHDMHIPMEPCDILDTLHSLQRLEIAGKLAILNEPKIIQAIRPNGFETWMDHARLPMDLEYQQKLGNAVYLRAQIAGEPAILIADEATRDITETVLTNCLIQEKEIDVLLGDKDFSRRVLKVVTDAGARQFGSYMLKRIQGFSRQIAITMSSPSVTYTDHHEDKKNQAIYDEVFAKTQIRKSYKNTAPTVLLIPSPQEIAANETTYADHFGLFLETAPQITIAPLKPGHFRLNGPEFKWH